MYANKEKGKISPITGPMCPEGSRKFRFLDYVLMAQNGGKVVSLTHRAFLTPRKYSWFSYLLEADHEKNTTPSGIEPPTFGFVAQHLNHCATVVSCEMYAGG